MGQEGEGLFLCGEWGFALSYMLESGVRFHKHMVI